MNTKKQYMTPAIRVVNIISENGTMESTPLVNSQTVTDPEGVLVKEYKDDNVWEEDIQGTTSKGGGLWDKAW